MLRARIARTKLTWDGITTREWIAGVSFMTAANRVMIYNLTFGILTARSWARIPTFAVQTSLVQRAF